MGIVLTKSLSCAFLWAVCAVALADDYADARAELVTAYQAQDYPAMVAAAQLAVSARPSHPGARFNLALSHALNGDADAALAALDVLVASGIDFGVGEMAEFAILKELPGWDGYMQRVAALNAPAGTAEVAHSLADSDFVPEGIALDQAGTVYLGSIRKGRLQRGAEVLSDRQGHWSVFGMRFHDDGSLWFASAAVAQLEDVGDDLGKTGLFRLDTKSGEVTRSAILPQLADQQVLGDLVIAGDVIYATDSLTGAIYRYDIEPGTFSTLLEPGVMRSPQGLVLDQSGRYLYVADYTDGLYRVSIADGVAARLELPGEIAIDYGIDGLYRHGEQLIAIQNGIRPHRVTAFELNDEGNGIVASRILAASLRAFDEPTLGAVRGGSFYFVANSHWNRFDRENRLPEGLTGPVVLKLNLDYD